MAPNALETPRLLLRPTVPSDAPAMFASYAADPAVTRFLSWLPHRDVRDTEAFIARCMDAPDLCNLLLVGRDDGAVRGSFGLRWPEPHRFEVGYVLARPWWGQGLMTEALAEVARWALRQPGAWRIGGLCDVDNPASARVMEKAGLHREGLLRRWTVLPALGDAPRDCLSYALTR